MRGLEVIPGSLPLAYEFLCSISIMSERIALEELYEETKGMYWYKKWNWCSDLSYSKWDGVKVDLAGHVVELDLRYNNLVGSLVELKEMHRLKYLKVLILSTNSLSGSLTPKFDRLECIEMLDLSWNQFSGTIFNIFCPTCFILRHNLALALPLALPH